MGKELENKLFFEKKRRKSVGDVCCHCGRKIPDTRADDVTFGYKGLTVSVLLSPGECESCLSEGAIRKIEVFKGKLFWIENGVVNVDWRYFLADSNKDEKQRMLFVLNLIGMLSYSIAGNWIIISDVGTDMNPYRMFSKLYFTREEDAKAYATLKYGRAMYGWEIWQIAKVITKEDLRKELAAKK